MFFQVWYQEKLRKWHRINFFIYFKITIFLVSLRYHLIHKKDNTHKKRENYSVPSHSFSV